MSEKLNEITEGSFLRVNEEGKAYWGQSEGGGGAFVVTITKDDGTGAYSADKTFEEISSAIEAGQNCVFMIILRTIRTFATLIRYVPGEFIGLNAFGIRASDFSHPEILDCLEYEVIRCMADNTWQNNYTTYKLTIL